MARSIAVDFYKRLSEGGLLEPNPLRESWVGWNVLLTMMLGY